MNRRAARWTLITAILASGIVFLDSSVVNVALPAIDRDLEAGLSGLQWVVDGYILTLVAFAWVENRLPDPMVPFELFRSGNFTGANLTTLGVYFALYGTTFFLVIYIQNVMGFSAFAAGLSLAPISLLMLVLSPRIGQLAGRRGPRLFMTLGPMGIAAGLLLLTRLSPDSTYLAELLPGVVVLGLGLATTVAPLTDTVVSAVPVGRAGVAAAFNNVVSRVAALLAVAGLGVILSGVFTTALSRRAADLDLTPAQSETLSQIAGDPTGGADVSQLPEGAELAVNQAYTRAFRWVMAVTAGVAFIAGLVAAVTIRNAGK